MHDPEGVIKYQLTHIEEPVPLSATEFSQINAWRTMAYQLGVIGQDSTRYGGLGFGNISQIVTHKAIQFIISGTQTGHEASLSLAQYCGILTADIDRNTMTAQGLCKPSSEALTHAMIYAINPTIKAIIHVHSPEIWHAAQPLNLPCTATDIPYGTPEMALAVEQLFIDKQLANTGTFAMLGHQDGIVSFGLTLEKAGIELIKYLAAARAINAYS
ncbi:MAG: class II aldolase/adducin family protein [Methylococcales bacterium]|jgi:ribulose-5-phosphate 4-epimerase/fuculose-1-phosphate aldolase|nr:class II aldolase/adducin family protein [Methylococcaceae bacterium]HIL41319.1 class II aldolase/adducin family protein [Methylococcales bacterium]